MLLPTHLSRAKAKHVTLSAIAVAAVAFLFFQWLMVPHPGSASNPGCAADGSPCYPYHALYF